MIAVCCFYLLFAGASELHVEPTWGWDQASVAVIGTAVGYLLYDLVYLFWCYEPGFEQFLLHHIVVILLYSYCALVLGLLWIVRLNVSRGLTFITRH